MTPEEHLEKADRALAAAIQVKADMDAREAERGRTLAKTSDWYLSREHDYLTLMNIVNMHANLATAKTNLAILEIEKRWLD